MAPRTSRYFATTATEKVGEVLLERLKRETGRAHQGERLEHYRTAYAHYYGGHALGLLGTTTKPEAEGTKGQLTRVRINKARSYAKAQQAIVLGPKLTWRPQAANSDAGAQAATFVAHSLLEHYWKTKGLEETSATWLEMAVAFSAGYVVPLWDAYAGRLMAYAEDGDRRLAKYEGDVRLLNVLPWDVTLDGSATSYAANDWWYVCTFESRYDLAECHGRDAAGNETPLYERILAACDDSSVVDVDLRGKAREETDRTPVWHFFHRPTPSLPHGRHVSFAGPLAVLFDRPLLKQYEEVPVYRLAADELFGTPDAYSAWWDTLGVQETRDELFSAVVSNNVAHGRQTLVLPEGTRYEPEKAEGLSVLYVPVGTDLNAAAKPLQMVKSAPETYELIDRLDGEQKEIQGLNDVALGNPERGASGAALALLTSRATEQQSPLSRNYVGAVGRLGYGLLSVLRKNVSDERTIAITGKAGSQYLYEEGKYDGGKLAPVRKVLVEPGNPLEQSASGRYEIAKLYGTLGATLHPEQVQQVLDTGRLDPVTDPARAETLHADAEAEALLSGEVPRVDFVHNHPLRARRTAAVLSNPLALKDPAVVDAVHEKIAAHYLEYYGVPMEADMERATRLRLLLGQVPPAMLAPPGMPPPGAPMPPPGDVAGLAGTPADGQPDTEGMPTMPAPPVDPMTGQPFDGGGSAPLPM